jgi:hypothetical protein
VCPSGGSRHLYRICIVFSLLGQLQHESANYRRSPCSIGDRGVGEAHIV